jgi:putative ABC transport system permease protein
MRFADAIKLALSQIRVQKLKSFFTLLGVTIGVMFLIAVVSVVEGLSKYMEKDVIGKIMAVNTFELRSRPNLPQGNVTDDERREMRNRQPILEQDVPVVAAALPDGTEWAVFSRNQLTISSNYARPTTVEAQDATASYFTIKKMGIANGRAFTEQEDARGATVVVIGQDVKDHFFPTVDPIGRELKIATIPYTVIGVAEKQGAALGQSMDKFVLAPSRSPMRRQTNRHGVIDAMMIQTPTPTAMIDVQERVREVMREQHHLRPSTPDDFSLQTAAGAMEFFAKLKSFLVIAGVALPAIGLVVGSIVIMNIMLVAVAERTQEIGVRKALGARRRDIMSQFLVESATLATLGAVLGVAVGFLLSTAVRTLSPLPTSVAPWSVIVSVVLGGGVGIIAGVYPASRASRLDPIAALRQE